MTASNTTDSTAFDITDWLGEWESFEHYIDSDDAAIQQTWEAAEQAVLANPKMAPMAARGIRTFWSMACSTTSPENIIHIGYWRVNERPPNPAPRTMPRSPSNGSPRTTPASTPTNTPSTMSSSTVSKAPPPSCSTPPIRPPKTARSAGYLPSIRCLRARRSPRAGCSATCISSTPTICTRSSPRMKPPASRPCAIRLVRHHVRQRGNRRGPLRHHPRVAPLAVDLATYGSDGSPLVKLASLQ